MIILPRQARDKHREKLRGKRHFSAGDPNPGGSATQWPKYTAEGDHILRLQEESEGGIIVETGLRKAACDWQQKQNPDIPGGGGGPDL
eukprot:COSAG06_NODE_1524_length_9197_cov_21.393430_8_plen_88_part_00